MSLIFGRHADHVDTNDAHNGDLKLLVCDDLEDQKLELDLQQKYFFRLFNVRIDRHYTVDYLVKSYGAIYYWGDDSEMKGGSPYEITTQRLNDRQGETISTVPVIAQRFIK